MKHTPIQASFQMEMPPMSFGKPNDDDLAFINALQKKRKKRHLADDEVLVSPLRLTGNQLTSIYTKFKDADMYQLAAKTPGIPLLFGHDTSGAPLGTFYYAEVAKDGDGKLWLDTRIYVLNDENGRSLIRNIETGVYNEASIGWTYTLAECSVCGKDYFSKFYGLYEASGKDSAVWAKLSEEAKLFVMEASSQEEEKVCEHYVGQEYDGKECFVYTTGELTPLEGSIVYKGAHPDTNVGGIMRASARKTLSHQRFMQEVSELPAKKEERMLKISLGEAAFEAETLEELFNKVSAHFESKLSEEAQKIELLGQEIVEKAQKIASLDSELEASKEELASYKSINEVLQVELDSLKEINEKLSNEVKSQPENAQLAEIGKSYLTQLGEEALALKVSVAGANAASSYEQIVKMLVDQKKIDVLKSEIKQLSENKQVIYPDGRLSKIGESEKLWFRDLDSYSQK